VAPSLPPHFRFGVASAGFQVEGGYNGPGQPANNWWDWEQAGRVERSGIALDFWNRWENHLDRALAAGCDAFRLSVEWARCEPAAGRIDLAALDRYAAIVEGCVARGLLPVVAVHHFAHPRWLGADFWLRLESPGRFAQWAETVASHLGRHCRHWITLNEPNALAALTWVTGAFPPGRVGGVGDMVRALDHLLTAHVLAYGALRRHRPDAVVSVNNHASSVYELDRLLLDVLLARSRGVARHDLGAWLRDRRCQWYAALPAPGRREAALRRLVPAAVPLEQALPCAVAAVWDGPHQRPLDALLLDYYNPTLADRLRLPGRRTAGGRHWQPTRPLWDDPVDPEGLTTWCRASAEPGLEVWVAENGLCNRVRAGRAEPRRDGWDRVRYLRANLAAVVRAADQGVPVAGYFHWTLADNYEWGSYEPRFGLYGVDREHGLRWSDLDSMGGDAAGAFRRLADGLRAGDRSVLR
jgi:beta-glucosidase/6-phospho-beta-glucosidase/beta-galactosidase